MEVIGRDGVRSTRRGERPFAYLSVSIPGFPNFFMLNGPNGPVGNFSLIEVAELQFGYVMQLIERCARANAGRSARPSGRRSLRSRPGGGREEDRLGHRLQELVPRRPRRPGGVALEFYPLPGGHDTSGRGRL